MKRLFIVVFLCCGILSCEEEENPVESAGYVYVEEAISGPIQTRLYEKQAGQTPERFTIVIDSVTLSEPVRVFYTISGSAEIGRQVSQIQTENSVVISPGNQRAVVPYNILTSNILLSDNITLTIRLTSVEGQNIRIRPTMASFTNNIRIRCTSTIPEGRYLETTENQEVEITREGDGTFSISNLNFRYYLGPEYGEIPGEFQDICGDVKLLGTEIEDKYRIAWIGQGTWDKESGILSLKVSDKTFNPDYKVDMKFQFID